MPTFVIGSTADFRSRPLTEVSLPSGLELAVVHIDGELRVLHGVCPHVGGPLGQGELVEGMVVCPVHGWPFDPHDGRTPMHPYVRVACFESHEAEGQLVVTVADPQAIEDLSSLPEG